MHNILRNIIKRLAPPNQRYTFYDTGFHGDRYLLSLVDTIIRQCDLFVETGTNVGSTLAYVARNYPDIRCYSCEPDKDAFTRARQNIAPYNNAQVSNRTSRQFLDRLLSEPDVAGKETLFWLDAHGYGFEWPLLYEIEQITTCRDKAFLLIDDFLVPGLDCFGYDEYEGQVCSLAYIKDSLNRERKYSLYYPQYTERTSRHHPLRGWVFMDYGHSGQVTFPEQLQGKIKRITPEF